MQPAISPKPHKVSDSPFVRATSRALRAIDTGRTRNTPRPPSDTKCSEKGCPFFAFRGELCRHHAQMFEDAPAKDRPRPSLLLTDIRISQSQRQVIEACFRRGESMLCAAERSNVTHATAQKAYRLLTLRIGERLCGCGRPSSHSGDCSYRSAKRFLGV